MPFYFSPVSGSISHPAAIPGRPIFMAPEYSEGARYGRAGMNNLNDINSLYGLNSPPQPRARSILLREGHQPWSSHSPTMGHLRAECEAGAKIVC